MIRESGGDRSAVTAAPRCFQIVVVPRRARHLVPRSHDRWSRAPEQKTPNEIALNTYIGLTIIFVFATATIPSYVAYASGAISVVCWSRCSSR